MDIVFCYGGWFCFLTIRDYDISWFCGMGNNPTFIYCLKTRQTSLPTMKDKPMLWRESVMNDTSDPHTRMQE
jgi:hypothetical protein